MRLRRKRVEAAARQGSDADGAGTSVARGAEMPARTGRLASLGDAFAKGLAGLQPREQKLVGAGAGVLLLALVIGVGVLPAWRSLQQGPARQQGINAQVLRVAQLEAQAQALKARPRWSAAEAGIKLQASSAGLAPPTGGPGAAGSCRGWSGPP